MKMQGYPKILTWIERSLKVLAITFFAIIFFAATLQIVMRWVFNNPLVWSEELIRLMFIWICYLGWVFATNHESHITITAFVSQLSPSVKRIFSIFNRLLIIVFSVLMVWFGIKMTVIGAAGKAVTLPVNFALVYVICPIANGLVVMYQVLYLLSLVRKTVNEQGV